MKEVKILMTGFEPFGKFSENPSEDVARFFDGNILWDCHIKGLIIPYDSRRIRENFISHIDDIHPDYVFMMGQSLDPKQRDISLERVASNWVDYEADNLYDNTGYRPDEGVITKNDGIKKHVTPDGEFLTMVGDRYTRISLDHISRRISGRGIDVNISEQCGTNFCNEAYYHSLGSERDFDHKTVFVHLPWYPNQMGFTGKWVSPILPKIIREKVYGGMDFNDQIHTVRWILKYMTEAGSP